MTQNSQKSRLFKKRALKHIILTGVMALGVFSLCSSTSAQVKDDTIVDKEVNNSIVSIIQLKNEFQPLSVMSRHYLLDFNMKFIGLTPLEINKGILNPYSTTALLETVLDEKDVTAILVENHKEQLSEFAKRETEENVEQVVAEQSSKIANEGYLPSEHYNYLQEKVEAYGLDMKKTLAVMKHESNFNPNAVSSTNDYGYFQINTVNHSRLSNLLGTPNKPLDPYVNIDWGTYMLHDLYKHWSEQGLSGSELDDAVMSSYNKGLTGYKKYGEATAYLEKWRTAYNNI